MDRFENEMMKCVKFSSVNKNDDAKDEWTNDLWSQSSLSIQLFDPFCRQLTLHIYGLNSSAIQWEWDEKQQQTEHLQKC